MHKLSHYFSFNIDRSIFLAHMKRLATSEASEICGLMQYGLMIGRVVQEYSFLVCPQAFHQCINCL